MTSRSIELIHVVDNDDQVIGVKARSLITPSDTYRVSALWLTDPTGKVLLAQRKLTKRQDPGMWGPAAAGTVEADESYLSNMVKEIQEEIGLSDLTLTESAKIHLTLSGYSYFVQWFTATIDVEAAELRLEEDSVEQVRWFTTDEIRRLSADTGTVLPGVLWALDNIKV